MKTELNGIEYIKELLFVTSYEDYWVYCYGRVSSAPLQRRLVLISCFFPTVYPPVYVSAFSPLFCLDDYYLGKEEGCHMAVEEKEGEKEQHIVLESQSKDYARHPHPLSFWQP
jgi:hypothetical protein